MADDLLTQIAKAIKGIPASQSITAEQKEDALSGVLTRDSYKLYDVNDTRRVRHFIRDTKDYVNPVLVEEYKVNSNYESIDPFIANGILLDYTANAYIEAVKVSNLYSYFVVFVKYGNSKNKYINAIEKGKDITEAIYSLLDNNVKILEVTEVQAFVNNYTELPELSYEDLRVNIDLQSTNAKGLYVDEPFGVKCVITYFSGSKDWKPYRYRWNVSDENSDTIEVQPIEYQEVSTEYRRNITCEVEFRLIEQPNNTDLAVRETANVVFRLQPIPNPEEMSAEVIVSCQNDTEDLYIDHEYRLTALLTNVSGNYTEWNLVSIDWNIPQEEGNMYAATFMPTEKKEYTITATATYEYIRNPLVKASFVGEYKFNATYMPLKGNINISVISHNKHEVFIIGDTVRLQAITSNITGNISPVTGKAYDYVPTYKWTGATPLSTGIGQFAEIKVETENPIFIRLDITYTLRDNPDMSYTLTAEKVYYPKYISPMQCDIDITYASENQLNAGTDKIRMFEKVIATAKPINIRNGEDWGEGHYIWATGISENNDNTSYIIPEKPGEMNFGVTYIVEDIYGTGRTREFIANKLFNVDYYTDDIGEIYLRVNNEYPQYDASIDITAEYVVTDDPAMWVLTKTEWQNVGEHIGDNNLTRHIDHLLMNTVVTLTLTFKHITYGIYKTITKSRNINIVQ